MLLKVLVFPAYTLFTSGWSPFRQPLDSHFLLASAQSIILLLNIVYLSATREVHLLYFSSPLNSLLGLKKGAL